MAMTEKEKAQLGRELHSLNVAVGVSALRLALATHLIDQFLALCSR
jgi:hypothetical protein